MIVTDKVLSIVELTLKYFCIQCNCILSVCKMIKKHFCYHIQYIFLANVTVFLVLVLDVLENMFAISKNFKIFQSDRFLEHNSLDNSSYICSLSI